MDARYAALFLSESREHLGTCNQHLGLLGRDPHDQEALHALFRAMHTIKSMAAMMGYAHITDLAHRAENVLEYVRSGAVPSDAELVHLLIEAVDGLDRGVEPAAAGNDETLDFTDLARRLDGVVPMTVTAEIPVQALPPVALPERKWSRGDKSRPISVTINCHTPMPGVRALIVLAVLEKVGTIHDLDPSREALEHESFGGTFSFWLEAARPDDALDEIIRSAGDVDDVVIGDAAEGRETNAGNDAVQRAHNMIRIDRRRLDAMMSHVGELVVARNRLVELTAKEPESELAGLSTRINRLVADIQSEVIGARMTPVWQVFDRFPRAVRDLAREMNKRVTLTIDGGDIEVDRALLDEIGDPVLHLLRNAVGHGIESREERVAAGKPAEGQLTIRCARDRDSVVFRIEDDGRGIDRESVLAKARETNAVSDDVESLDDDLLLQVLGRSGFSTAESVTSVSGRGVGIDIVLTKLRGLGGVVALESELGQGTTFVLRLPLTLVIFRALLAQAGDERYVLPMAVVAETVQYDEQRHAKVHGQASVVLRDEVLSTADLRTVVGQEGNHAPDRRPCVILEVGERRSALLVDALLGQQEIVVEAFDPPRGMPACFSGATILADGTPALILDAAALV
jgi:two-component system chemotaxis sensor kinase CheA